MKVPFIDIKRYEDGFLDEWDAKVSSLSSSASFIGGNEVSQLETNLCQFLDVENTVTCSNGTDALQIALRASGVEREDLVLIPDVTFWATFEAVINVGAKPICIDVDESSGGVDEEVFYEAAKKFKPKAAILAHLYGWGTPNLKKIRSFCEAENIILIEDGAQCFGVNYQNQAIYKDALISTTSFYPAKVLGAAGDGGAIFTNNEDLADKARKLSNHGRDEHYGHGYVGWNSRLDTLQAAFLNISMKYINHRIRSRRQTANKYKKFLANLNIQHITPHPDFEENGYANLCIIKDEGTKSKIQAGFQNLGIGFGNIYPGAMSDQKGAKDDLASYCGTGKSKIFCKSVFNLPLFPYMNDEEINYILRSLEGLID